MALCKAQSFSSSAINTLQRYNTRSTFNIIQGQHMLQYNRAFQIPYLLPPIIIITINRMRPLPLTIALVFALMASARAHALRTSSTEIATPKNTSQNASVHDDGNRTWHSRVSRDIMTVYLLLFDVASALLLLVVWVRRRFGYDRGVLW